MPNPAWSAAALCLTVLLAGPPQPGPPRTGKPVTAGIYGQAGGLDTWVQVRERGLDGRTRPGQRTRTTKRPPPVVYEYRFVPECQGNSFARGDDGCRTAFLMCRSAGPAAGPLSGIWRRRAGTTSSAPTTWERIGQTCSPGRPPTAPISPTLTTDLIRTAWARTPFARPSVRIEPAGQQTLVGLPTYFTVAWPTQGYRPGQLRSLTLAGHHVRIRPALRYAEWHHGDGTSQRTRTTGGPYPTGEVIHTYPRPGTWTAHVVIGYSGHFSIDGSPWAPVADTIRISGPPTPIQVFTATNRLLPNP